MIVGNDILRRKLFKFGKPSSLKHGTYDLSIGSIVPIGISAAKERENGSQILTYYLRPQEMIWVISEEEFDLPADVTGLATLRTTLTKKGLLALNVGIIDPFFSGPISTVIINFSDKVRKIDVGEKFFRIVFFEHDDVSEFHLADESVKKREYENYVQEAASSEYPSNFLNIPELSEEYYGRQFGKMVFGYIKNNKIISSVIIGAILLNIYSILPSLEASLEFIRKYTP